MPTSLKPLAVEETQNAADTKIFGRLPFRHRIAQRVDALGAQVPTRPKVPSRSVTPIY